MISGDVAKLPSFGFMSPAETLKVVIKIRDFSWKYQKAIQNKTKIDNY